MKSKFTFLLTLVFILFNCSRNMTGPSSGPGLNIVSAVQLGHPLQKAFFIDEQHGWALTDSSGIYRTTDGGSTWEYSSFDVKTRLTDMSFVSSATGWVCGFDTTVLHTTDGGRTWTRQMVRDIGDSIIHHIKFSTESDGWLVTTMGSLFGTTDGGVTWNLMMRSEPPGIRYFNMWGSRGIAEQHNGIMRRTEDGWQSWTTLKMPAEQIGQTFFINPDEGWLMQTFPPYS
jgi:photosystem II stability/assembly factor-like uncharacterized protein